MDSEGNRPYYSPDPVYVVMPDPENPGRFQVVESNYSQIYQQEVQPPLDRIFFGNSEEAKRRAEEWAKRLTENAEHPLPTPPAPAARRARKSRTAVHSTPVPPPTQARHRDRRVAETLSVDLSGTTVTLSVSRGSLLALVGSPDEMAWLTGLVKIFQNCPLNDLKIYPQGPKGPLTVVDQ